MVHRYGLVLGLLVLSVVAGQAAAETGPVFGPENFELTAGETESFTESFVSEVEGRFVLYVRNGDGESSRVDAASVSLNGVTVVGSNELSMEVPGLKRKLELQPGEHELTVELSGEPGSFVTLVIAPHGHKPRFVHGRLLLPWGRSDDERGLALALKNGSARFPRQVRVVFFGPGGAVVATSEKFGIPPRGSLAVAVEELIAAGDWEVGSVEIFYAGPGVARLFGSARQSDLLPNGQSEIAPLEQAGFHLFGKSPEEQAAARRR
jgi:hypothetical protein